MFKSKIDIDFNQSANQSNPEKKSNITPFCMKMIDVEDVDQEMNHEQDKPLLSPVVSSSKFKLSLGKAAGGLKMKKLCFKMDSYERDQFGEKMNGSFSDGLLDLASDDEEYKVDSHSYNGGSDRGVTSQNTDIAIEHYKNLS